MDQDTFYDYEPLAEENQRARYCGAPRHKGTNVQAKYIERYRAPELGITEEVNTYSCEDCHDSMLQAFMDAQLPPATEEELREAELSEDDIQAYRRFVDGDAIA